MRIYIKPRLSKSLHLFVFLSCIAVVGSCTPSTERPSPEAEARKPPAEPVQEPVKKISKPTDTLEKTEPPPSPPAKPPPKTYTVDPSASEILILVDTSGRLSKVGTDHIVNTTEITGEVVLDDPIEHSHFTLRIPVNGLVVDDPEVRKRAGPRYQAKLDPEKVEQVRTTMLNDRVLDALRYPEVLVAGDVAIGTPPDLHVNMEVSIHGISKRFEHVPVQVERTDQALVVSGELMLRQSDFGITPLSLLVGSLKVEDTLSIRFRIVSKPTT